MSAVSPDLIEALRVRLKAELEELDALLQQTAQDSAPVELDQQSVGGWRAICTRCGEAISEKRLKVDPTYLLCVNCAL